MSLPELSRNENPLYVPYIEAQLIEVDGYQVYPYISPKDMGLLIEDLARKIILNDFEHVLYNNDGGKFLFEALSELQGYDDKPIEIEYHPTYDDNLIRVDKAVPSELKEEKLLVIEDVYDRGITLAQIKADAPNSTIVVAVKKINVPNQIIIPGVYVGVEVDNHWLGGVGMNFGPGYPEDFPRNYPGVVIKSAL